MPLINKPSPFSLGVPLKEIYEVLISIPIKTALSDYLLEVFYEDLIANVEVKEFSNDQVRSTNEGAITTIKTYLPKRFLTFLSEPEFLLEMNKVTTFASLVEDEKGIFLGSRLTSFKKNRDWNIFFPLLLFSLICSNEVFYHCFSITLGKDKPSNGISEWKDTDFQLTKNYLDSMCWCTADNLGLTAKFKIDRDTNVLVEGNQTALWKMHADSPHPSLGGGLLCILELPFEFERKRLIEVVNILNISEMLPHDLPPHFGAWTVGNMKNKPAYVSFLPNVLHDQAENIQTHMSIWAFQRVQTSVSTLKTNGII